VDVIPECTHVLIKVTFVQGKKKGRSFHSFDSPRIPITMAAGVKAPHFMWPSYTQQITEPATSTSLLTTTNCCFNIKLPRGGAIHNKGEEAFQGTIRMLPRLIVSNDQLSTD